MVSNTDSFVFDCQMQSEDSGTEDSGRTSNKWIEKSHKLAMIHYMIKLEHGIANALEITSYN